jgi:hypothetical protein
MPQRDPSSLTSVPVILYYGGTRGFGTIRASNSSDCGFSPSSDDTSTSHNAAFARVRALAWQVGEERTMAFDNHKGRVA